MRAVHRHGAANRTYNLTVDSVHTYYVLAGNVPVLVHNCSGDFEAPGITVNRHGVAAQPEPCVQAMWQRKAELVREHSGLVKL